MSSSAGPDERSGRRLLATVLMVLAILGAVFMFFVGSVLSEEGYYVDGEAAVNGVQSTITLLATVALLVTVIPAWSCARDGSRWAHLKLMLGIDALLLAAWVMGLLTWCSGCGAP